MERLCHDARQPFLSPILKMKILRIPITIPATLLILCQLIKPAIAATQEQLLEGMSFQKIEATPEPIRSVIVENFPDQIILEAQENLDISNPYYTWFYALADLDGSGVPDYLVVLYTNGFVSSISVFKDMGEGYNIVWEDSSEYLQAGISQGMELIDVDNDAIPEIQILKYSFGANTKFFEPIIKWDNGTGRFITPPNLWGKSLSYIDVDQDKILDISVYDYDYGDAAPRVMLYKLKDGEYQLFNESVIKE